MWDDEKKLYKKKKFNADGQMVDESHKTISRDKKRIEKMQDRYKQWRKSSVMNLQKIGDTEVASNTSKALSSFKNRMTKKQLSDSIKRRKELASEQRVPGSRSSSAGLASKFGKKEGFFKGRKVQSELKTSKQIAKNKVQSRLKTFGKGKPGREGKSGGFKNKAPKK